MFTVSLVTNSDCYDRRSPVTNEPLSSCVEDGFAADCFRPSTIDLDTLELGTHHGQFKTILTRASFSKMVQ